LKQIAAMNPITEPELRNAVREALGARDGCTGCRVIEEMGIENGAARVDVAVIGRGLEAFELKSDLDSFARMPNQIHAYNRVFDEITIVTGPACAEAAQRFVPSWWGIVVAERAFDDSIVLRDVRLPSQNPQQEFKSLAALLWRDEASSTLQGAAAEVPPRRATKRQLYDRLAQCLSLDMLRERVVAQLLARVPATRPTAPERGDDWSHLDASYSDFHYLT
jgi:hypothetical protein